MVCQIHKMPNSNSFSKPYLAAGICNTRPHAEENPPKSQGRCFPQKMETAIRRAFFSEADAY
ncbi:hypothetical protein AB434_2396 [Heyndrickxia coagulans]|nr:hypothetical protein AB434_2396 [Heyndrickxia coagulans]KYC71441.1 hypothetical protein B4096_0254 [Heyndrickxia coagulans]